jgi:small subunit ribosomal protein S1
MDGLVHITDISWTKVNSPSEVLNLGEDISVKVLKFDQELSRLSLGIKQLSENPWDNLDSDIMPNNDVEAKVNSINDTGINLLIKNKYDGVVTLNEMTWLKKPPHPSKLVSVNDAINVKIIEVDNERKKIFCSLKQTKSNPWEKLSETVKINDIIDTEIVNIVDFGIFVKVHDEIDGMVHVSDLSWDEVKCQKDLEQFKKGDKVKVKILEINAEKERVSLGIKQLESDPLQEFLDKHPIKSVVSGKIIEIDDKFLKISLDDNIIGTIKRSNLSKDKNEQRVDRFALEEKVDSIIISVDQKTRTLNLSIKEIEINDEKEALSKYGSSDSGASLGDILGSILKKKE